MRSFNLCACGEIFRAYFCKKCDTLEYTNCKRCHEEHFSEINRMKELSRLKRDFIV